MTTPTPVPVSMTPNHKLVNTLNWLKILLPIFAGVASIWIHNTTTAAKIGATVGTIESGLNPQQ